MGNEKPIRYAGKTLNSDYVTAWCGMICDFLVNRYFFDIPTPRSLQSCNVTGSSYGAMLREHLIPPRYLCRTEHPFTSLSLLKIATSYLWCVPSHKQRFRKCLNPSFIGP
ncbi:hypothetical protein TNCV_4826421 [Trichonephila clavipes]|nr:hypothetical protein TNCV_4826421 [Trichonephila clavipes]